jgi:hypothetical protein
MRWDGRGIRTGARRNLIGARRHASQNRAEAEDGAFKDIRSLTITLFSNC